VQFGAECDRRSRCRVRVSRPAWRSIGKRGTDFQVPRRRESLSCRCRSNQPGTADLASIRSGRFRLTVNRDRRAPVDLITHAVRVSHVVAGHRTSNQTAVVAPVESDPWTALHRNLILKVSRLVVALVVVDAKGEPPISRSCACTRDLWREESCRHRRHDHENREVVEVGHVRT